MATETSKSPGIGRVRRHDLSYIDVRLHCGGVGDPDHDDTDAIEAAIDLCSTNAYDGIGRGGPTLVFPEAIGWRVTRPIVVPAGIPVEMRNTSLMYDGADPITVLTLGEVGTRSFRCRYHGIDVRRDGNVTRTSESDIGVRFLNTFFSDIYLRGARDFGIGAQFNGVSPGEGCYYNTVRLGYFYGNMINLDLKGGDGLTLGWVNENLWLGGEFLGPSDLAGSYDRWGVRIWTSHGNSLYNDQNVFKKPSFEMNGYSGNTSVPFLILHSHGMTVENARQEGTQSTIFARIENNSRNSDIHVGHQQISEENIEDVSTEKSTMLRSQKFNWSYNGRTIYTAPNLATAICKFNATRHHVPGLNFYRQVDTTLINNSGPVTAIANGKLTISATDAIARMVNTTRCKKFAIAIDSDATEHPWVVVQCFDAAGAILDDLDSGHPFVAGPGFAWAAAWAGYTRPDTVESERLFTVGPEVNSIRVGIYAGKARSFTIRAIGIHNQHATTYSGYEDVVDGANIGTQAPNDGTWVRGRVVYNAEPSAGGAPGWVCTASGTPGTWKAMAAVAA